MSDVKSDVELLKQLKLMQGHVKEASPWFVEGLLEAATNRIEELEEHHDEQHPLCP